MKHFLLEGEYLVPFEEFAELVPKHREFLQRGYDAGFFLCSGPQIPARGGFLLARAESLKNCKRFWPRNPSPKQRKCALAG